jgi:hypothetical protein
MKIEIDTTHLRPGDLVTLTSERPIDAHNAARLADQIREKHPGVTFVVLPPFVSVHATRPSEIEWARWFWQSCPARHADGYRCERYKRHDGPHAAERGMDIHMWFDQMVVTL